MGGDGGGEFLHMRLPPGVDIRNMHLDGIQACTVVLLYFWLSSVRAHGSLEMEKEKSEEQRRIQEKIKHMGKCPMDFEWIREDGGWIKAT